MSLYHLRNEGMSFNTYLALFEELVKERKTSGPRQMEKLVDNTRLNLHRTKRILKTVEIPTEYIARLEQVSDKYHWLVLSEMWCGDSANTLPLITKLANVNPNIKLHVFLRDEHPRLMHQFLTDGKQAIPKLICCSDNFEPLWTWGARPEKLQHRVDTLRLEHSVTPDELKKQIQVWYLEDEGETFFQEFMEVAEPILQQESLV